MPKTRRMIPSEDPESDKYPYRRFYMGRWRTPEEVERKRAGQHKHNARQIRFTAGGVRFYCGQASTPEEAKAVLARFAEFRARQAEERKEFRDAGIG